MIQILQGVAWEVMAEQIILKRKIWRVVQRNCTVNHAQRFLGKHAIHAWCAQSCNGESQIDSLDPLSLQEASSVAKRLVRVSKSAFCKSDSIK